MKQHHEDRWKKDFKRPGLSTKLWGCDLRASAITEARRGGSPTDAAAKVAGHTKTATTAEVYDREGVEAARRFQPARLTDRNK